jgi:short chain dehydrogenase
MAAATPASLLRPDLLAGQVIALSAGESGLGPAVAAACAELGAAVEPCPTAPEAEAVAEQGVAAILDRRGRIDTLVVDADAAFAAGTGAAALRDAVDATWHLTRAVANAAMIPGERGGKVVFLAPGANRGAHAEAARAGLENMARTLSIEWARHGIRLTTVAPGARTSPPDVGTLVAYLASPAGDYFSGCRFGLDSIATA